MNEGQQVPDPAAPSLRLLRTKLFIPRAHPDVIERPRLAEKLNEEDNTPAVFLKHLENTISRLEFKETLPSTQEDDLEDGMISLINHLSGVQAYVALIFDNYQAIRSPSIHAAVQLLLDYLPPQVHAIIASQSKPSLALPRMRVRRQLLELGLEDLHMKSVDI